MGNIRSKFRIDVEKDPILIRIYHVDKYNVGCTKDSESRLSIFAFLPGSSLLPKLVALTLWELRVGCGFNLLHLSDSTIVSLPSKRRVVQHFQNDSYGGVSDFALRKVERQLGVGGGSSSRKAEGLDDFRRWVKNEKVQFQLFFASGDRKYFKVSL